MPSAELKLAYSSLLERLRVRRSSAAIIVKVPGILFFKIGKLHDVMRASEWSGYVSSTVHHTATKAILFCLRLYGCNLRSIDGLLSVSVYPLDPRVFVSSRNRHVAFAALGFLASSCTGGQNPCETRVGEMITSFCGLLEKNNPRFDLTRLDPRAGIVFLFLFDDICLRLATFGLV
jgi:hypothetical protein